MTAFRTAVRTLLTAGAGAALAAATLSAPASGATVTGSPGGNGGRVPTYTNPVSRGFADTFADPSVIRAKDGSWYAYATSDPLRSGGAPVPIPIARSTDLVHWTDAGAVFASGNRPSWATATSGLWAPDIRRVGDRYLLYYVVTDTTLNPGDDSAIGVATAPSPTGPWTDSGGPLVAPRPAPGGGFLWTFDPDLLRAADGSLWLYYGSYFGGIWVQPLRADGLATAGPATQVTIDNRYEGAYVVRHSGWYYLMTSAANCCAGPTTGYAVLAGRSRDPRGPFVDRFGHSLLASRVGGTPVIAPNGNRWVGTGHNAVVTDDAGQDWFVYHAIDRGNPFLDEPFGINRRPMLIDRLQWVGGWPSVRAGRWASDTPQPTPVVRQDHHPVGRPVSYPPLPDPRPGRLIRPASDEFRGGLAPGWSWVRQDPQATVAGGALVWPTQAADLVGTGNDAGLLLRRPPAGDWLVETKVSIDLGVDTVRNFEQAGLVVRRTDDEFLRLSHVAIWNTRQVEFGKEMPYADGLSYGGNVGGPPGATTWLRLTHTVDPRTGEHRYRAGSSPDGRHWTWQGVWTLPAGPQPTVGLGSMGGSTPPATARFDYLRFFTLAR